MPSAHEAVAVVDRPTNNGLISPFLLVFPFLPSFATQSVHFSLRFATSTSLSLFLRPFPYLSLSFFPLLLRLLLFLRSRTTFPRPKVERSPGSESTTSGIAHARKRRPRYYIPRHGTQFRNTTTLSRDLRRARTMAFANEATSTDVAPRPGRRGCRFPTTRRFPRNRAIN